MPSYDGARTRRGSHGDRKLIHNHVTSWPLTAPPKRACGESGGFPPKYSAISISNCRLSRTKSGPAGSIRVMKCEVCLQSTHYLLLALLLLFAAAALARKGSKIGQLNNASGNPQDFFVRATNSSFSSSFRYDPHATDEWLFHSGARAFATSPPLGTITTTNWFISIPPKDFHTHQK